MKSRRGPSDLPTPQTINEEKLINPNSSHLCPVGADAEVDLNRAGILVERDCDLSPNDKRSTDQPERSKDGGTGENQQVARSRGREGKGEGAAYPEDWVLRGLREAGEDGASLRRHGGGRFEGGGAVLCCCSS
jgi:hypothetical protein